MPDSELVPNLKMIASTEFDEESGLFKPVVIVRWTGVQLGAASDETYWVEMISRCFENGRFASQNEATALANHVIEFVFKLLATNVL